MAAARDRHPASGAAGAVGVDLRVVAVAGRDGLVSAPAGIDLDAALALREAGEPVTRLPDVRRWPSVLEALAELPWASWRW